MTTTAYRVGALAALAAVSASWVAVALGVVSVVGGVSTLALAAGGALALAWLLRDLSGPQALALGVVVLLAGFAVYLLVIPEAIRDSLTPTSVTTDTLALLTGFSIYRLVEAGAWATAVTPAPLFLTWYFGFRRNYSAAALVAGGMLGFFVLTGDAGAVATLVGTVAALLAVACGRIADHGGGGKRQAQLLAAGVAVCVLAPAVVTAVPGGAGTPLVTPPTPTTDLSAPDDHVAVGGRIRLSPKVNFVASLDGYDYRCRAVNGTNEFTCTPASDPPYYRVASYDRFTGTSWLQTGASEGGSLRGPPGPEESLEQTITLRRSADALPAAAEPVDVDGIDYSVTRFGNLRPDEDTDPPTTYRVESERVNATPAQLRAAGTDYPEDVAENYLQVPETTDPAVARVTANVTADAETPYGKARAIESWLAANREYDLDAPNPRGNLVNYFVLSDDATGYCTYYATSMVTMLRTQGIPARFAVGYTSGQQVDANQWVVRGYDSHAWVEAYFPEYGWVRFDPTPGGPRQTAETDRLETARENGTENVDALGSDTATTTTTTTPDASSETATTDTATTPPNATTTGLPGGLEGVRDAANNSTATGTTAASGAGGVTLPPPGTLALWGLLGGGLVGALQYSGLPGRVARAVWLRRRLTGSPEDVAIGAFARVEYVLERTYRPRRDGETVRAYLDAVRAPDSVRAVAAARERARYGTGLDDDAARAAARQARAFVAAHTRLPVPDWW
ncbi:transglutaminase family protein [Halocalculus aciditolerans]|uniref:Transglutaminase-like domain-containing protein n=1 Tax=Halocalculus aciditolerans TaxID=1383812 RepID=A0A830F6U5_9EURY|nr:transglutaminase domain-containing protein [Halocalculus aciditolerans]GGL68882.1 hypothetical protein GCM10009039_28590 [Halocalculus aciditolerans]